MTRFRASRADTDLSNYWNALVRNAPAEELARLARLVEPSEIAAIERARAAHQRYEPDPVFARRLEQTIMYATFSSIAGTIPQLQVPLPSKNGSRDPGPISRRQTALSPPSPRAHWTLRPALAIGLLMLLVLASAGGIWMLNNGQNEPHRLLAPVVATPTPEASPGWAHWRGDATRSGATNFGPINQPVELWRYQATDFGFCGPVPAVAGDTVYLACAEGGEGRLYAFARTTGEIRWTFTADSFVNGVTIAGGLAYVMGEDSGALYAVDIATGEERWRYAAASVMAAPAVTGGMAFVNTAEGFLIGLDAVTGEERWRTTTTTGGATHDAALLDGMAYVGSETGDLTAVDAATGEIVWQVDTGDERNGLAVVADGIVYVGAGALTGSLSAYDAETGALLWERDEPMLSPSVANGVGYSGSSDGTVYAFDAASGEELWRVQVGGSANPIAIAGDIIYVPSVSDLAVYALDAATGDELWHVTLAEEPSVQAAVVDGAIYVATSSGVIQAFGEGDAGAAVASPAASPVATPEESHGATPHATPAT